MNNHLNAARAGIRLPCDSELLNCRMTSRKTGESVEERVRACSGSSLVVARMAAAADSECSGVRISCETMLQAHSDPDELETKLDHLDTF